MRFSSPERFADITFCPELDNTTWLKTPERENEKYLQGGQYLPFSRTDGKTTKSSFFKWIHQYIMVCNKSTLNLEQIYVYSSYT